MADEQRAAERDRIQHFGSFQLSYTFLLGVVNRLCSTGKIHLDLVEPPNVPDNIDRFKSRLIKLQYHAVIFNRSS